MNNTRIRFILNNFLRKNKLKMTFPTALYKFYSCLLICLFVTSLTNSAYNSEPTANNQIEEQKLVNVSEFSNLIISTNKSNWIDQKKLAEQPPVIIASSGSLPCGADCNRCSDSGEDATLTGYFPNISTPACVTGEDTAAYNCIAWSVGNTNDWIWDDVDDAGDEDGVVEVSDFDAFYALYGLYPYPCGSNTKVRLYCKNGVPTHADKKVGSGRYESKLGPYLRIRHGSDELEGGNEYGDICKCYAEIAT